MEFFMKKIALFSLSLLMFVSAVSPVMAMDGQEGEPRIVVDIPENQNQQEGMPVYEQRRLELSAAKSRAKFAGIKTGFYAGIFSGLGLGAFRNPEKIAPEAGFASLIGAHMLSNIVWKNGKTSLNEEIKGRNFTQAQRKEIRKNFHRHEFLSNVATTAAAITAIDTIANNNHTNTANPFLSAFTRFSAILVGTYVWKSFTYGPRGR
jgi:hypothetical protein